DRELLGEYLERFSENTPAPWSVLAITFTNKAANEIKARLESALGEESGAAQEIWAGTFHSICMRIIRRYGEIAGFNPNCGIADTDDAKKLIADCMKKLDIDTKNLPIKTVMNQISRAKDKLIDAENFALEAGDNFKLKQIAKIYDMYAARLKESNLLDFDDIIMQTVLMLQNSPELREKLQKRFRYVCVDEFQDTNEAQLELTKLLSGGYKNVMVVGDDDQSIYRFRGATIENILRFDEMFDNVKVIKLEQNYRSTKTILDAANGVIAKNEGRRGKNLWTDGDTGDKISLIKLRNQLEEARHICDTVNDAIKDGREYRDFAVLYRTNAQSRSIEQAMAKSGIPYRLLGGVRFFDRMEIKDIISYLCVINNPLDSVHLRRIVNVPKRGIGDTSVAKAEMIASTEGISLLELMRNAPRYPQLSSSAKKMQSFAEMMDALREAAAVLTPSALIKKVISVSGYEEMIRAMGEEEADRLDNLGELVSTATTYEESTETPSLSEFLEDVALVSDVDKYDETADAVVLMTIHSAKGLEFPEVFLPGMEEELFPSFRSSSDPADLEEERRLAYVAITRAKEKLHILHVHERMLNGSTQYNRLSRFVDEIPQWLLDITDKTSNMFDDDDYIGERYNGGYGGRTSYTSKQPSRTSSSSSKSLFSATSSKPVLGSITQSKPKAAASPSAQFNAGDSVRHATFGVGTIVSAKPMGGDVLYEINFEKVGTKKLMGSFARLSKA
ncbi:MAG: UvrD-helicase domain-containing protein, partial [Clostridia bacterium]|nr:UvrD-helicase domain-containing protein [Clostridia bacterium]